MKKIFIFMLAFVLCANFVFSQKTISRKMSIHQPTTVEIPFTLDHHLIVIKGKLGKENNNEYDFIFDTGATGIYIWDSIAKRQAYTEVGKVKEISPEGNDMGEHTIININNLYFKNLFIKLDATLMPKEEIFSPTAIGVVGLSAFDGYVVTIDYKRKKILLKRGALKKAKDVISLNESQILEGNILLNGNIVPAHFDCGAPSYISIPIAMKDKCKLLTEPKIIGKARTVGGEMDILAAQFDGTILIGSIKLIDPKIEFVTANFPAVNIGFRFFNTYKISMDIKNKLMKIENP
jgi:hypothetical protein